MNNEKYALSAEHENGTDSSSSKASTARSNGK